MVLTYSNQRKVYIDMTLNVRKMLDDFPIQFTLQQVMTTLAIDKYFTVKLENYLTTNKTNYLTIKIKKYVSKCHAIHKKNASITN